MQADGTAAALFQNSDSLVTSYLIQIWEAAKNTGRCILSLRALKRPPPLVLDSNALTDTAVAPLEMPI